MMLRRRDCLASPATVQPAGEISGLVGGTVCTRIQTVSVNT